MDTRLKTLFSVPIVQSYGNEDFTVYPTCCVPGCSNVAELAVRFELLGEEYFLCADHGALKKDAEEFREKVKE